MLVSLADMKIYLGIASDDTSYDAFLTEQLTLVSEVVEAYCRRKFVAANYEQTYYGDEYCSSKKLQTFHYPLIEIGSITEDGEDVSEDDFRVHLSSGTLTRTSGYFFSGDVTIVSYEAGYADGEIPTAVLQVVKTVVEERHNKKSSGVSLNFGSDVQRISIPGTISIDFDYTLANNDRKSAFGSILGSNLNILDFYRSDRALLGQDKLTYVEET